MTGGLSQLVDDGLIDASWVPALRPVDDQIAAVMTALAAESDAVLPSPSLALRAFRQPFDDVRVLIVGQDPYPTPGHAIGLAFAVERGVRPLPRSLVNIYRELSDDLGIAPAPHGDLSAWESAGVLLLNRVLTVRPGEAGSHRRLGWEAITAAAIQALAERETPLVAVLWGKDAAALRPLLADVDIIESAHPSPLSARRGFFGSRPFSRVNASLVAQGAEPLDWHVV